MKLLLMLIDNPTDKTRNASKDCTQGAIMEIPSPRSPSGRPNRDAECAIHMENAIMGLWGFFEDAGWTEDEFNRALLAEAKRTAPSEEQ